jgi:hypothetical protein
VGVPSAKVPPSARTPFKIAHVADRMNFTSISPVAQPFPCAKDPLLIFTPMLNKIDVLWVVLEGAVVSAVLL